LSLAARLKACPTLARVSLALAAILFLAAWLTPVSLREAGALSGQGRDDRLVPLLNNRRAEAVLRAERPGLAGVRVLVATYGRRNRCRLEAELLGRDGKPLALARVGAYWLKDWEPVDLIFPRLRPPLPPGSYRLRFRCLDSGPADCVALFGPGQGAVSVLAPIYATGSRPLLDWLARRHREHYQVLLGFIVFLAAGGGLVGLGAALRARS